MMDQLMELAREIPPVWVMQRDKPRFSSELKKGFGKEKNNMEL